MLTAARIAKRCSTACPNIEKKMAGWKSDRSGRCGCICWMGVAYEKASCAIMSSHEEAIICRSDERAPSSESADSTYAEMRLSSIMICCCCSAESSVQRPCRTRSTMLRTDGERDVKGAATEASPGRTIGSSLVPSPISAVSFSMVSFLSKTLPWTACSRRLSSIISRCTRARVAFMMRMCPITPSCSPRASAAAISSLIHSCCFACSSFCLALSRSDCTLLACACLSASVFADWLSASSALLPAAGLPDPLSAVASPPAAASPPSPVVFMSP
mmetsp:Transcript_24561/g.77874  ORF Transcript_24561/g.77874 Transcript_24561/m.77874 type:complete len:273 (-) Transcript_24561:996-1814(-)